MFFGSNEKVEILVVLSSLSFCWYGMDGVRESD